jgi:translation initiation factor 3 subunit F
MPMDDPKDFSRAYEAAAALYDRANPREQVVGWYVTVSQSGVSHLPDVCVPLHSFFGNRVALPVVVAVDTSMHAGKVAVRGYMTQTLVLREMQSASDGSDSTTVVHVAGTRFTEVTTNLKTNAVEIAALDALRHASSGVSPYSASNTSSSGSSGSRMPYLGLDVLGELVSEVLQYVEDVVAGKEVADAALGRAVADALAAVSVGPQEEEAFEKAFAALVTDMAMVMYLTQMTKAQIGLAEKLVLASAERVGFEKPARADAAVEGAAAEGGAVVADE